MRSGGDYAQANLDVVAGWVSEASGGLLYFVPDQRARQDHLLSRTDGRGRFPFWMPVTEHRRLTGLHRSWMADVADGVATAARFIRDTDPDGDLEKNLMVAQDKFRRARILRAEQ